MTSVRAQRLVFPVKFEDLDTREFAALPLSRGKSASSLTFEGRPPPKLFVMADEESKQGEEAKPNTMQLKVVSQDGTEGVLLPPHVPALVSTQGAAHARWRPSSLSAGDRQ